jgi:hypothetical protein
MAAANQWKVILNGENISKLMKSQHHVAGLNEANAAIQRLVINGQCLKAK